MRYFFIANLVGFAFASPTMHPPKDPKECAKHCMSRYETCCRERGVLHAVCKSECAECLGFSPFGNRSRFVTPTTCISVATMSAASTKPAETWTPTETSKPSETPKPSTAAEPWKSTETSKPTEVPVQDTCAKKCTEEWEACKSKPDANQSYCGSLYGNCLGYAPFGNGQTGLPTACSKTAHPTSTGTPAQDVCAKKCTDEFDACRIKPEANQSLCASDYGTCLGYIPYIDGTLVTPTACAKPVETGHLNPHECAIKCTKEWEACKSKYGADKALCCAQYEKCLGYSPFVNGHVKIPTTCCYTPATPPTHGVPATSHTGGLPAPAPAPTNVPAGKPPSHAPVGHAPAPGPGPMGAAHGAQASTPPSSEPPVVTGAGARFEPAHALLALGALALL